MNEPHHLSRPFPSRDGRPIIERVDLGIFRYRYFTHCLQCGFCHDACCEHGVDVEAPRHDAILKHASELERLTGVQRDGWFRRRAERDDGVPGGLLYRTRVRGGACVFLNRDGRGCLLHQYSLGEGIDYHDLKSMVDCLFPITFEDDVLCVADEIEDGSLVCVDTGPTLYRGVREEIRYYFGDDCVAELDALERTVTRDDRDHPPIE